MTLRNLIGVLACLAVFLLAFALGDGRTHFLNVLGLAIVLSGTVGATLLSYPSDEIRASLQVAWNSYAVRPLTANQIVDTLLDLSVRSRAGGRMSLQSAEEQTNISFLRSALGMLVDGYERNEMREIMTTEMQFFRRRRQRHERVFRHMSRLAPAFGVAGSVVGLIGMLVGIGDTAVILQTIPLALTSTLYGILLCNFVLTPIAESIAFKTEHELLLQKLIVDGVSAIYDEHNPHKLEKRLTSFLTPAERQEGQRSLADLRRRYLELRLERASGE